MILFFLTLYANQYVNQEFEFELILLGILNQSENV